MSVDDEITVKAKAQCSDTPPSLLEGSDEIQRSKRVAAAAGLLSAALFLVAVAATVGGASLLRSHASGWLVPAAFVTGAFFFISSVVVPLGVLRESGIEAHEKENCRKDCRDLLWALEGIGDGTLKRLAWINFQQLRAYSAIAQKQARMSYYASLAAAAISLLTLASGAAVAIGLSATTAKVTVGALATAGSVLSGFLVKVFLESYQMASRQMSYYYGQPLVHCYLMHAQWLASEAREHSGDEAEFGLWQKVVEASIKASANAQDHLLSMQEPDPARRGAGSAHRCKTRQPCQAQASRQSPMPDEVESLLWANHPNGLADNLRDTSAAANLPLIGMCGKPASTPGERRAAGNPIRTVQGGAAGERGSGVGRLRAGRHLGVQGLPPARSAVRRRPNSASGYSNLTTAAAGTVLRVILCPVGVLRCLACGSTGCGWCATGREPCS